MPSFDPPYYQKLRDDQQDDLDGLGRHLANYGDSLANIHSVWRDQAAQRVSQRYIRELQNSQESLHTDLTKHLESTEEKQSLFNSLMSELLQSYECQDSYDELHETLQQTDTERDKAERKGLVMETEYNTHQPDTEHCLSTIDTQIRPI